MKRLLFYILCFILSGGSILAGDVGLNSPFGLGTGAYELSLGGANLARCRAVSAPFWNPSGLAQAEHITASAFHCRLYDSDVAYQYFGLALPSMDWGCVGLGVFRLGIGGIEKRDENNVLLDEIRDNRLAIYLAYGKIISGYNMGLSFSIERHELDSYHATSSPALSLSIGRNFGLETTRFKDLSVALNLRNIIKPGLKLVDENISYPFTFDLGTSFRMQPFTGWDHDLILSSAVGRKADKNGELSFGAEYNFNGLLQLRGGVRDGKPSFGCGLNYKFINFDYALIDRDLGSLHMFSLTTSFGLPISEKRKIRAEKREEEFKDLMNTRLVSRNQSKIKELVNKGKESLGVGEVEQASSYLDRAMFLARANGIDTTEISALSQETHKRLKEIINKQKFAGYMDSAQTKFNSDDFMGARYFAGLALTTKINNEEAQQFIDQADRALTQALSQDEMISRQLINIDSLLNYGYVGQALAIAGNLVQFVPNNERTNQILRRTQFENWRLVASDAFTSGEFKSCMTALDSALAIFPEHRQCLELKERAQLELNKMEREITTSVAETSRQISGELLKEVETIYNTARQHFENGELSQAVSHWEKIERLAPDYKSVREYLIRAYKFIGVELYGQNRLKEPAVK